jgi:hypothetical protein
MLPVPNTGQQVFIARPARGPLAAGRRDTAVPDQERSFRVKRSPSGRWTIERIVEQPYGGGNRRELSGTYATRQEAERALLRYMREESGRYRRP